jgi:hypothetical protein
MYGVTFGFDGELLAKSLVGFGYNVIVSIVVFWSMQLISKVRLTINND